MMQMMGGSSAAAPATPTPSAVGAATRPSPATPQV